MISRSPMTRSVYFAYLFGPPRFIQREEAYEIHGQVCRAIGCEDLAFQYLNPEAQVRGSRAFCLQFQRKEGRGAYTITIDNPGMQAPVRLLMQYVWPPSVEHVTETMDGTSRAVFDHLEGRWQKVLAEVRIRAQCEARENDGLRFMKEAIFRLPPSWFESLGQAKDMSAKFEVPASTFSENSMDNPRRELLIETLKEDPGSLFIELMSRWPHLPEAFRPAERIDVSSVRQIEDNPSAYIGEAYAFLQEQIAGLDVRKEGQ